MLESQFGESNSEFQTPCCSSFLIKLICCLSLRRANCKIRENSLFLETFFVSPRVPSTFSSNAFKVIKTVLFSISLSCKKICFGLQS